MMPLRAWTTQPTQTGAPNLRELVRTNGTWVTASSTTMTTSPQEVVTAFPRIARPSKKNEHGARGTTTQPQVPAQQFHHGIKTSHSEPYHVHEVAASSVARGLGIFMHVTPSSQQPVSHPCDGSEDSGEKPENARRSHSSRANRHFAECAFPLVHVSTRIFPRSAQSQRPVWTDGWRK